MFFSCPFFIFLCAPLGFPRCCNWFQVHLTVPEFHPSKLGVSSLIPGVHPHQLGFTPWLQEYNYLLVSPLSCPRSIPSSPAPGFHLQLLGICSWSARFHALNPRICPMLSPRIRPPLASDGPGNIPCSGPGYMPRFPVASPEEILHFVLSSCENSVCLA